MDEFSTLLNENQVLNELFSHRSIREFKTDETIPNSHKEALEKIAQRAATSCSGQMYSFIEIEDNDLRNELYEVCGKQSMIKDANLFYVVLADLFRLDRLVEEVGGKCNLGPLSGTVIAACDASFAAQNLVIAAEALGYGTIYIGTCGDKCKEVAKALQLPERVIPLFGLGIGIPAEDPPLRPRIDKSLIFHKNKYRQPTTQELQEAIEYMATKLEEEGYYDDYTDEKDYRWNDHLLRKFGGVWLDESENARSEAITQKMILNK
jgi:FMN reductase (NADPH)